MSFASLTSDARVGEGKAGVEDRLAVLGYERLEDWAGVENLEERVDADDAIDPFVLERLRARSS